MIQSENKTLRLDCSNIYEAQSTAGNNQQNYVFNTL